MFADRLVKRGFEQYFKDRVVGSGHEMIAYPLQVGVIQAQVSKSVSHTLSITLTHP